MIEKKQMNLILLDYLKNFSAYHYFLLIIRIKDILYIHSNEIYIINKIFL